MTHACFDPAQLVQAYPRGSKALRGALTRFQPKDTIAWFESRGVKLKTEADGRMFPTTDRSETVIECLVKAAATAGVRIRTGMPAKLVTQQPGDGATSGFAITLRNGEILECDRLLLATGSNPLGYRWAKALGHAIEPPVPSLFTFNIPDPRLQGLAGVSVPEASLRLPEAGKSLKAQSGPLLVTHWGISGPAVLKLSAWGARFLHERHYQTALQINWLPQYNPESLRQVLLESKAEMPRRAIASHCPLPLPKRLWQSLTNNVGIAEGVRWAELPKKALNQLIQELIQGQYLIQGKGVFKEEFVTCGGVRLKEVNFKTMESRLVLGLYFAGEILDIDGVTGGFNFQSAWTTGWLAGQAMGA